MLKNYLRIAYRNLLKNGVFSFVNVFGLTIGMVAFLLIIHYVRFERSYENFNPNADNLYRVTLDIYNGSEYVVTDCETHAPLGPLLKRELPEITDYVRLYRHDDGLMNIKVGTDHYLEEAPYYADPSVFKLLDLKLLHGDARQALRDPKEVALSETTAKKYFGRTDVIGEAVEVLGDVFRISAVFADLPPNTHLKFGVLFSHATLPAIRKWYKEDDWNGNNEYTYLLTKPDLDLVQFNKKISDLCVKLKDKIGSARFVAEPVKSIHLYSNKTYEPEANGNARAVNFLLIIASFILIIAWVNYINLSTARAVERSREVGIRKVMGSAKIQLILQFLSESLIINLFAGTCSFILFQVLLPLFRDLTGQPLPLTFLQDQSFWFIYFGVLLAGSLLSGTYPAFVLSSFQPVQVLKGKFRSSLHGQHLRKALVVFQFAATVILMAGMGTVYLQVKHLRNVDLGVELDQTLVVRTPGLDSDDSLSRISFQSFKNGLLQHNEIQRVGSSGAIPGVSLNELGSTSFTRLGKKKDDGGYTFYIFGADADFIPTLNMNMIAGRNFEAGVPNHDRVIVNEEAVHRLGFENVAEAIGSKVTFQTRWPGEPATIIGVLKNFYQRSPKEEHIPMLLRYSENSEYISVKLKSADIHETLESVRKTWDRVFPNSQFVYFFMQENYDQQFQSDIQFGRVMATFSGLAVLIACLGLFGLSSYIIVQRTKEIGIRKVLGASVGQIVQLLSQDFANVVLIAALIALPAAYFVMDNWLSHYAVRIQLSVWIFIIPVVVILSIAMLTVSFQTIRTALANPAKSLKQE